MHYGTGLLLLFIPVFGIWWLLNHVFLPPGRRIKDDHGRPYKLPPGPKGIPLFGSLIMFSQLRKRGPVGFKNQMLKFAEHGEMTTLHLGAKTWILLNNDRVSREIIAKRSAVSNERSAMPISSGIVSNNARSLLMHQKDWMEPRRIYHQLLSGSVLAQYAQWQELESTQLLAEYLLKPQKWHRHHYRFSNSVVHRISLGFRWLKSNPELEILQDVNTSFINSIGGSIIDFLPQLAQLPRPLQFLWRPYWEKIGQWHNDVYRSWWDPIREDIHQGKAPPSYIRDVLLHPDTKYTGTDTDGMFLAMQLIGGGSNTTRESLNIFVMASICNPDVYARARTEVDKVCGTGTEMLRLPGLADMPDLPYITGMVKEILRWRPIFPMIPDHTLSADMEFEEYYFPKGTGFIVNGIAVAQECEDPEDFKPERWLDGHEAEVVHGHWQFGGGRRFCPGYKIAQRNIFINVARLVYCFDYEAAGPIDSYRLRPNATDEPFPVKVKVRSEQHKETILAAARREGVLETTSISLASFDQ